MGGIFSPEEVDARQEILFENYVSVITCEAETLIEMIRTGVEPACAKDLAIYSEAGGPTHAKRKNLYASITSLTDSLEGAMKKMPSDLEAEAEYLRDKIK